MARPVDQLEIKDVRSERDRLLDRIEEAIEAFNPGWTFTEGWDSRKMADAALRVIEDKEGV